MDDFSRPPHPLSVEGFFWAHVRKAEGCWEWQGQRDRKGYGRVEGFGWSSGAHRVSWVLAHGDPGDLFVCHRCDNPPCVRPDHLFLGTAKDNAADCAWKGRVRQGEKHHKAKLTAAKVRDCRERWAAGASMGSLAREYGVDPRTMSDLLHRRSWKGIP